MGTASAAPPTCSTASESAVTDVQQSPDEVVHLYVDPHYGSDDMALGLPPGPAWNPDGTNAVPLCPGTPLRPNDVIESTTQFPLRHAPHPFSTIGAALRYIGSTAQRAGLPAGTPPLPYPPNPQGGQKVWTHAIIHLLPGLYAPTTNWYPDFLAFGNGESFPLVIPPRVSIQGTSGLNTIIMPTNTTAFVFGAWFDPVTNQRTFAETSVAVGSDGSGSFLSCLTFYAGGRDIRPHPLSKMTDQAAVLVDGEVAAHPTITNCFFVKNWVGVLINAYAGEPPQPWIPGPPPEGARITEHHGTAIIGNTFCWNGVGVWNGQFAEQTAAWLYGVLLQAIQHVGFGRSRLAVVNNVFDSTVPGAMSNIPAFCGESVLRPAPFAGWRHPATWPFALADSSFEGVPHEDMLIVGFGDSNAYEEQLWPVGPGGTLRQPYNLAHKSPQTLNLTRLPPVELGPNLTTMPTPAPTRNIADFTGYESNTSTVPGMNPRGVLFVRDIFCLARYEAVPNTNSGEVAFIGELAPGATGFDGSPLDFRLSPTAAMYSDDVTPLVSRPAVPNPLVNNGFDIPASGTFTMANGLVVGRPGDFGHPNWGFDAWRTDVEGFANQREHDHPDPGYTGTSVTDIGADELGDLVVAGYRMGTTMLVRLGVNHPKNPYGSLGAPYALENHRVYILGPANTSSAGMLPGHVAAGSPAPMFRIYGFPSFEIDWPSTYDVATDPGPTWHSVETSLPGDLTFSRPWRFDPLRPTNPPAGLEFLYLGTTADITPHLLPDPHPWWSYSPGSALPNGIPPTLTLWQDCLGAGNYNGFLYQPSATHVTNPPASSHLGYPLAGAFEFQWLDGLNAWSSGAPSFRQFHRWVGASGISLDAIDSWCRVFQANPLMTPEPQLPDSHVGHPNAIAIRFTLEHNVQGLFSTDRNIQSFMVLVDGINP